MKPYLAIDTSGDCLSLALGHDDGIVLAEAFQASVQNDALEILLQGLLQDAKLTVQNLAGILFARGPGSFTGLRISTACVQGICLGANLSAWPIPSLEAGQARIESCLGKKFPVLLRRARKGEWYRGSTDESGSFQTRACTSAELLNDYANASIAVLSSEQDALRDEAFAGQADILKKWQFFPHEPCASGLLSVFAGYDAERKAFVRLSAPQDFSNFHPLYLTPVSAQTLAERQVKVLV